VKPVDKPPSFLLKASKAVKRQQLAHLEKQAEVEQKYQFRKDSSFRVELSDDEGEAPLGSSNDKSRMNKVIDDAKIVKTTIPIPVFDRNLRTMKMAKRRREKVEQERQERLRMIEAENDGFELIFNDEAEETAPPVNINLYSAASSHNTPAGILRPRSALAVGPGGRVSTAPGFGSPLKPTSSNKVTFSSPPQDLKFNNFVEQKNDDESVVDRTTIISQSVNHLGSLRSKRRQLHEKDLQEKKQKEKEEDDKMLNDDLFENVVSEDEDDNH